MLLKDVGTRGVVRPGTRLPLAKLVVCLVSPSSDAPGSRPVCPALQATSAEYCICSNYYCRDFVNAGATQGQTPSDVIFAADVTFSCITNPDAAKELVFGNCGVLAEIKNSKGYVEMTGIDAETSRCIGEAIVSRGGRYLEAQIQGSKLQAELGTLVILAAGDHALYNDCQSCFTAMGKSSFFIGSIKFDLIIY
ncbi:unnamed protein product, partial [Timema podura]|nr:unnamed protein product [Timema podura]